MGITDLPGGPGDYGAPAQGVGAFRDGRPQAQAMKPQPEDVPCEARQAPAEDVLFAICEDGTDDVFDPANWRIGKIGARAHYGDQRPTQIVYDGGSVRACGGDTDTTILLTARSHEAIQEAVQVATQVVQSDEHEVLARRDRRDTAQEACRAAQSSYDSLLKSRRENLKAVFARFRKA